MTAMSNRNQGFLTVCYYRWDKDKLKPDDLDTSLCTHLILGFTEWVEGGKSRCFHEMVSDPSNTDRFVACVVETLRRNNLDGIDVDWEFPMNIRNGKAHFSRLLQKLRTAFDDEAVASGQPRLILSAAVAAQSVIVNSSYSVREIERYVDFINLMTYDLHLFKWYYPFSGHNSPLHGRRKELGYFATLNIASSAKFGMVFLASPWGKLPKEGGYITYPEVCQVIADGGKRIFDKQSKVPYVVNKKHWISYDDINSVELKARWILSEGYGGIMTFSLNCDDCTGATSPDGVRFPLHKKIKEVVEQESSH
ncbi:hypothetical protein MRX96_008931 [Rhipicephalus microplus]